MEPDNAERVSRTLREFGGFSGAKVRPSMFLAERKIFIFGREPVRIDVLTAPSGVDFADSYRRRNVVLWDGIKVPLISFEDLKKNKQASGRLKDLADLEHLPPGKRPRKPTRPVTTKQKRRRRPPR